MIRLVKPSDSDLAKLLKDFKMKSVADIKKDLKKKKEEMLVMKSDNELIGVIKYKNLKSCSRIESFYLTKKELRGRGFGTQMYNRFEKRLKGKKHVEAYVYQTNRKAVNFWEKNGFKIIKEDKDDKGDKLYYMKKQLRVVL